MATNNVRRREPIGNVIENSSSRSHSRKRRGRWPGTTVFLLLGSLFALAMAAIGCGAPAKIRHVLGTATPVLPAQTLVVPTVTPPSLPIQVGGEEPTPSTPSFAFAVFLAVTTDKANAGNVAEIRTAFRNLKKLGINIVVQSFVPESTKTDWKAYLDAATQEDMKVIVVFPKEPPAWDGNSFDLGINRVFLESMHSHPALYAFFLVDEPFHKKHGWEITTERLQLLYQQAKKIAPNVPVVVQFSREIQKAEEKQVPPRFAFKRGMCDICVISALEFRNYGQGNLFYSDMLVSNHSISRAVIKREDPDAKIWTTIQAFGSATGQSSYYMPSADGLQQMVDLLLSPELQAAGALDGMLWQQWMSPSEAWDATQYTLADPEFEALRNVVKDTAKDLGLLE